MIATLRAIAGRAGRAAGRLRGALGRHTVAASAALALAAGAAGIGGGFALSSHTANAAAPAPATTPTPTPAPSPATTPVNHARSAEAEAARQLIALVAKQTGQSVGAVRALLKKGETLDQVAGTQATAVTQAADAAVKAKLDAQVSTGKLTQAQETTRLDRLDAAISTGMSMPGTRLLHLASLAGGGGHASHTPATTPSPSPSPSPGGSV